MKRIFFVSFVLLSFYLNVGGCLIDKNVTDFTFQLPQKTFSVDTATLPNPNTTDIPCTVGPDSCAELSLDLECGAESLCVVVDPSRVPEVPCDPSDDPCPSLGPQFFCDPAEGFCGARLPFELMTRTDLANEVPELKTAGSYNFTTVRLDYIRMRVVENTFSASTPPVDLFVGPETSATLHVPSSEPPTLSPGVEKVGRVASIPAGVSGHTEDVALVSGGSAAITNFCRTPEVPFHMFVYSEILVAGGDPIPQGRLVLEVDSAATVGLQ